MEAMGSLEQQDLRGFRRANLLDPTLPDVETNPLQIKSTTITLEDTHYQLICALIIPSNSQLLTLPRKAISLPEISMGGVCYSPVNSAKPYDSNILFRCPKSGNTRTGSISLILQYTYNGGQDNVTITSHFLIINERTQAAENVREQDPFRRFGFAGGFLCSSTFSTVHAIPLSNLISHCSITAMMDEFSGLIHVLPLDRVGLVIYL